MNYSYYNDHIFQEIPSDVLANYPYAYISALSESEDLMAYYLLLTDKPMYLYKILADGMYIYIGVATEETNYTSYICSDFIPCWIHYDNGTIEAGGYTFYLIGTNGGFSFLADIVWTNTQLEYFDNSTGNTYTFMTPSSPIPDKDYKISGGFLSLMANGFRKKIGFEEKITPLEMLMIIGEVQGYEFLRNIKRINILNKRDYQLLESTEDTVLYEIADNSGRIVELYWKDDKIWEITWDEEWSGSELLETYPYFFVMHNANEGVYNCYFTDSDSGIAWQADGNEVASVDIHYKVTSEEEVSKLYWGVDYYKNLSATNISGTIDVSSAGGGTVISVYANFEDFVEEPLIGYRPAGMKLNIPDNPST